MASSSSLLLFSQGLVASATGTEPLLELELLPGSVGCALVLVLELSLVLDAVVAVLVVLGEQLTKIINPAAITESDIIFFMEYFFLLR